MEIPSALREFGGLLCSAPWLSRVPRDDGHPVITIPAFAADDSATVPLRFFLSAESEQTDAEGNAGSLC